MTTPGTAVATKTPLVPSPNLQNFLQQMAPQLQAAAPKHFTSERIIQAVMTAVVKNRDIAKCTPDSIALAVMRSAELGLDIGVDFHLVPLNSKVKGKDGEGDTWVMQCEGWADYKGLQRLARQAGIVRDMVPFVVWDCDTFEYEYGTKEFLRHIPGPASQRKRIVYAWARILKPGGIVSFHVMPVEDIEARRRKSRAWGKGDQPIPWYCQKTVVRDWLNRQPKLGTLLEKALEADDLDPEALAEERKRLADENGELRTPLPIASYTGGDNDPPPPSGRSDDDLSDDQFLASQG